MQLARVGKLGWNTNMHEMLWVMRHAEAGPAADAKDDDQRPLTDLGIQQSKAAGKALSMMAMPIQCIMCGTTKRCIDTANLVGSEIGLKPIVTHELNGSPVDIHALTLGHGNCLLVGHEPCVSLIAYRLTGAQMRFTRGGLVQIHEGELWAMLNACELMIMAGMELPANPTDVNHRSEDDAPLAERIRTELRGKTAWAI